jgi:RNA polymerase sigma-70 factor (ECF subfamily)
LRDSSVCPSGAGDAVKHLLVENLPRVYRFALRLAGDRDEAEEIVQETCLRAWRRRESLRDRAAVRTWLLRIAANVWRDRLRRGGRRPDEVLPPDIADRSPGPDCEAHDEVDRVLRLMDALPARQRQVLYLSAIEELDQPEIARVLEISPEAVKASLSLARKTMRKRL